MASASVHNAKTRRSPDSAFGARHFGLVWFSGLLWHLTRWGVAFLGSVLIDDLTGSPRLIQLAGVMLYAPLLVGGVIGGTVSDRFDRLATVRIQLAILIPASVTVGVVVSAGRAPVWLIYGFMFLVGVGWVTDMTSRRALVFDLVGPARVDHAMAMESLSLSSGMVLGALVGGSAVAVIGLGPSYYVIAGLLVASLVTLAPVRSPGGQETAGGGAGVGAALADLVEGVRALRTERRVFAILGVTVIANFFLFAYFPLVPVIADRLGASPVLAGVMSAGTGMGMMIGSLLMARLKPPQRGLFYVGGLFVAFAFIVLFASAGNYPMALAALIGSGFGSGLFASTQSTLVMAASPPALRGRALGLLSMAIGALPLGMYCLGELAERIGVRPALTTSTIIGAVVLGLWSLSHRQVAKMTVEGSTDDRG